jgi:hypothetical protein
VFSRLRLARGRDALLISPFLLASILWALVSTAWLIALWYSDVHTAPTESGVAPTRASLIVSVGVTTVAWAAVVFVVCRDAILRRLDDLSEQISQTGTGLNQQITTSAAKVTDDVIDAAAELAEQAEASGVFRGIAMEAKRHSPDRRLRAVPRTVESADEPR